MEDPTPNISTGTHMSDEGIITGFCHGDGLEVSHGSNSSIEKDNISLDKCNTELSFKSTESHDKECLFQDGGNLVDMAMSPSLVGGERLGPFRDGDHDVFNISGPPSVLTSTSESDSLRLDQPYIDDKKVDEWLKFHRSDVSLSSVAFEIKNEANEDVIFESASLPVPEQEPKFSSSNGAMSLDFIPSYCEKDSLEVTEPILSDSSIFQKPKDIDTLPTLFENRNDKRKKDYFVTANPVSTSNLVSEKHREIESDTSSAKILSSTCILSNAVKLQPDDSIILNVSNRNKTSGNKSFETCDNAGLSKNMQITSISTSTTESCLTSEERACLEELERGSQLSQEEQELFEESARNLQDCQGLEFQSPQVSSSIPVEILPLDTTKQVKKNKKKNRTEVPTDENCLVKETDLEHTVSLLVETTQCTKTNLENDNQEIDGESLPSTSDASSVQVIGVMPSYLGQVLQLNHASVAFPRMRLIPLESVLTQGSALTDVFQPGNMSAVIVTQSESDVDGLVNFTDITDKTNVQEKIFQVSEAGICEVETENKSPEDLKTAEELTSPVGIVNSIPPSGSKKKYQCPHADCNHAFPVESKLRVHLLNHDRGRPYKCTIEGCDWSFVTAYKLRRHLETHVGKKNYLCDFEGCNRRFTTIYNLNSHKRLHKRPKSLACPSPGCGQTFATRRKMELHLKVHDDVDTPYKCPVSSCGKGYYSANSMASHLRVHQHKEEDLKCPYENCLKVFGRVCRLKQHLRQHTGERPYVCNFEGCGWTFVSASKLTRHMRKHTGERKYACPEEGCGKSFMRPEHLKGHMVVHSGDKPFACHFENCNARFTARSSLYVHVKKHSGTHEKLVYPCPIASCSKKYNCKSSLRLHLQKVHSSILECTNQDYVTDYVTYLSTEELREIFSTEDTASELASELPTIPISAATSGIPETQLLTSDKVVFNSSQLLLPEMFAELVETPVTRVSQIVGPAQFVLNSGVTSGSFVDVNMTTAHVDVTSINNIPDQLSEVMMSIRDVDLAACCVQQENNSGSARTDFCSNHILSRRLQNQRQKQLKLNLSCSPGERKSAIKELKPEPKQNKVRSVHSVGDIMLTQSAITFQDSNPGSQLMQSQLLQDDLSVSGADIYTEDQVLTPVSLLQESNVNDPTSASTDFVSTSSGVGEFPGSTVNLQDLD
ncbi:uncharacterized protein LOC143248566 isoform X2 [Tachypleus tridentatus]|uniref:uncharacterized protein LOC143248566 isoform X2 n=1 Tax=Tachypleus tridentatus TaxID=6853 RepID=UPI003FD3C8B4